MRVSQPMIIHQATTTKSGGRCRISAVLELETPGLVFRKTKSSRQELWIDWPADYFNPKEENGAPFLLISLPLAMSLKERIVSHNPVSDALLVNVLEAMAIYEHYFPDLCEIISIEVQTFSAQQSTRNRIGSFYSGGVDSLYNIAEHRRLNDKFGIPSVTDLWLIQGMDIKLSNQALWKKAKVWMEKSFAASSNVHCVDIRTNARDIHDGFVRWVELGFGPILAGIAKCFSPIVRTALIGSYASYDDIIPNSSTPLLDPMWSCNQQMVRHFSCRTDRIGKIETISKYSPELLQGLRVCYKNETDTYNCGKCEKCMRTQLQLMLTGNMEKCTAFPEGFQPSYIRNLRLPWRNRNQYTWDFWQEIEAECNKAGYTDFAAEIRNSFRRNNVRRKLRNLGKPTWDALRKQFRK